MKTIELNISERVYALAILNGFKGSIELMAAILEDIKKFTITDEDWERAERVITESAGNQVWSWNDDKGGLKVIDIDKDTAKYIRAKIEEKDKNGEFTLQDKAVITLKAKLN